MKNLITPFHWLGHAGSSHEAKQPAAGQPGKSGHLSSSYIIYYQAAETPSERLKIWGFLSANIFYVQYKFYYRTFYILRDTKGFIRITWALTRLLRSAQCTWTNRLGLNCHMTPHATLRSNDGCGKLWWLNALRHVARLREARQSMNDIFKIKLIVINGNFLQN